MANILIFWVIPPPPIYQEFILVPSGWQHHGFLPYAIPILFHGMGVSIPIFEVTREHELIWEYINPYQSKTAGSNLIYRAYRLPYHWIPQVEKPEEKAETTIIQIPHAKPLPEVCQKALKVLSSFKFLLYLALLR